MRIRLISDLHLEHLQDGGAAYVAGLGSVIGGTDVLLIAGDLTSRSWLDRTLGWFRNAVGPQAHILYVVGNHELYGTSEQDVMEVAREAERRDGRLAVLDDRVVVIGGQRFVGSPLWFPYEGSGPHDDRLQDFRMIDGFREWVGGRARRAREFLVREVRRGDIVLTHHLPHPSCVGKKWRSSPLNRFFVHDMGEVIEDRGATLWCHGHTHQSNELMVGRTRVICNPAGYPQEGNPWFDAGLVL